MARFTLLTLNINGGFDVSRSRFVLPVLRDAVRGVDADIVLLQEVLGAHARHAERHSTWPRKPQHAYLGEAQWPHQVYGANARFLEGHQGNAIVSRVPIAHSVNHDVSIPNHEPRGLLQAVLTLPDGQRLHVANAHLGLRETHRREQIDGLCRFIERDIRQRTPLIVAGDFNDWRQRGHPALRAAGLVEAFEVTHGHLAKTFPSALPLLPLDRIYVHNVIVHSIERLSGAPWSSLSDHVALLAHLEIPTRQ